MSEKHYVYLDYAASAPLRTEARDAWLAYHDEPYGMANPNSLHTLGREASARLETARRDLARAICCGFRPSEIVLTSGGTESNNLAVLALAEGQRRRSRNTRTRVVLSAIEHDSVLDVASLLRGRGFEVELARPGRDGVVSADEVRRAMGESCALVSVMAANNETGVVQPTTQIVAAAHEGGALAFAAAATLVVRDLPSVRQAVAAMANRAYERLCAPGTGIVPTTVAHVDDTRLPGMLSLMVPGMDSESLVLKLDDLGFEVSAGSACSSGSLDPSHVLSAMGIARDEALGALRVSFDERVKPEELDAFCDALLSIVQARA